MKLRKLAGYKSRDSFADYLGVNRYTYKSWESGAAMMNFEQACMCADALNCTTDALAGREVSTDRYTDKRQTDLNKNYEALTDEGKDAALGAVRGIRASESARANEEGPTNSEQVSA